MPSICGVLHGNGGMAWASDCKQPLSVPPDVTPRNIPAAFLRILQPRQSWELSILLIVVSIDASFRFQENRHSGRRHILSAATKSYALFVYHMRLTSQ